MEFFFWRLPLFKWIWGETFETVELFLLIVLTMGQILGPGDKYLEHLNLQIFFCCHIMNWHGSKRVFMSILCFLHKFYLKILINSPLEGLVWIKHFNAEALFYVLVSVAVKAKYKASFLRLIGLSESDFGIETVQLTFLFGVSMFKNHETLSFVSRKPSKVMDSQPVDCHSPNRVKE